MRLETIINAWHKTAMAAELGKSVFSAFHMAEPKLIRRDRQAKKFREVIEMRIDDYRCDSLNEMANDLRYHCPREGTDFWPYRARHARYINELVAAGVMELAQREPARWRFVQK